MILHFNTAILQNRIFRLNIVSLPVLTQPWGQCCQLLVRRFLFADQQKGAASDSFFLCNGGLWLGTIPMKGSHALWSLSAPFFNLHTVFVNVVDSWLRFQGARVNPQENQWPTLFVMEYFKCQSTQVVFIPLAEKTKPKEWLRARKG